MMKKIISLLLIATLCFGLCACSGDTETASTPSQNGSNQTSSESKQIETQPFEIEFKNQVDGYIQHYYPATYVLKTDRAGRVSCDDFYVSLTKGSKISCDKPFAFYCYSVDYSLSEDIMTASGLKMDKYKPEFKAGSYTLAYDCLVRFSVEGSLLDIKVEIPKGHENLVEYGSRQELEFMPTVRTMTKNLNGRDTAINYIFITDIHYGSSLTDKKGAALLKQVESAVNLANTIDSIDFVCVGGDTTTGMYETKEEAIKYTTEILEPLKNCTKPVFVLMGNHDDNSYHRFTYDVYYPERIISDKDWNDFILEAFCPDDIKQDSNYKDSKYFYYDLKDKKTRVICLDSVDYRAKYNSKGVISELPIKDASATTHVAKYWSGCSWWGYSNEQLKWLMNEALTADNDWNYVFLSHMGIDSDTNAYNYKTLGGAELRKIISAYQNKTTCRIGTASADFTKTKGSILVYQFGHQHIELVMKSDDIDLWQVCTATAGVNENASTNINDTSITNKTLDWKILSRAFGTETEACFDLMSVDKSTVQKWGLGASTTTTVNQ